MAAIQLRESDMCRAKNLNRKNDYGLDNKQMMRLINAHREGDAYKRALIEFRLTDINFHREVEMLMNGKYDLSLIHISEPTRSVSWARRCV